MTDFVKQLDGVQARDIEEAPPLRVWPPIGAGVPAVWLIGDHFAPGYISGEVAVIFELSACATLAEAAFAARIASGQCCG